MRTISRPRAGTQYRPRRAQPHALIRKEAAPVARAPKPVVIRMLPARDDAVAAVGGPLLGC